MVGHDSVGSIVHASLVLLCASFMIGPGLFNVERISKCEGSEEDHLLIYDFIQRKYNRTHDAFNATIILKTDFDHSFSVEAIIYKYVDGGYKLYSVHKDGDMMNFLNHYAEENVRTFLELAGVDPPTLPIKKGTITATNYIYDYEELPGIAVYGRYIVDVFALDREGKVVGCIHLKANFEQHGAN